MLDALQTLKCGAPLEDKLHSLLVLKYGAPLEDKLHSLLVLKYGAPLGDMLHYLLASSAAAVCGSGESQFPAHLEVEAIVTSSIQERTTFVLVC